MKKIMIVLVGVLIGFATVSFAQTGFKFEKTDSVSKTKSQLYSDTKMFIAETWKSAHNVIQNDDKEAGMILVKGLTSITCGRGLTIYTFTYSYNVKFLMKNSKYKIIAENIQYLHGPTPAWDGKQLNPQDEFPGMWKAGIGEKPYTELMTSLKTEMQSIVDSYQKNIKTQSLANSGW